MSKAGAQNRRIGEFNLELGFGEGEDFVEVKLGAVGVKGEFFVCAGRGVFLVRTGEETFGTAEKVITNFRGEFGGDIAC